jgi:hypothetical protein
MAFKVPLVSVIPRTPELLFNFSEFGAELPFILSNSEVEDSKAEGKRVDVIAELATSRLSVSLEQMLAAPVLQNTPKRGVRRRKEINLEDIKKEMRLPCAPLLGKVFGKPKIGTLLQKMCALQSKYLDETKGQRLFYQRRGAFGYQEVFLAAESILKNFRTTLAARPVEHLVVGREKRLENFEFYRKKMQMFFEINFGLLNSAMKLLKEKLDPQIGNFRGALLDFAQVQQGAWRSVEIDSSLIQPILQRLCKLERELKRTSSQVRENKLAFQPLAQICRRIESNNIQGLTLLALDGKLLFTIPSSVEPSIELFEECKLAAKFYESYAFEILDPHIYYCDKLLTAIVRFKLQLVSSHVDQPSLPQIGWKRV